MKNCVYLFTNKVNGKKYVGQAVDSARRYKQHIATSYRDNGSRDYNCPFHNAIRKYGIENFTFEILLDNLTKEEMDYWEIYYIQFYDTLVNSGKGYNVAAGGNSGNKFAGKTPEEMEIIKRKIGEKSKGRKANLGKTLSEDTKKKISDSQKERLKDKTKCSMYGKQHSKESKQKNSDSRKGKCSGAENGRARKVGQYTLDAQLIATFDCVKHAEQHIGVTGGVTGCCKGKRKTCGGFKWKYVD